MASSVDIGGFCNPQFERVKQVFEENFEQDEELGASLAVFVEGEPAVDIWGGFVDRKQTLPWQEDTITLVFSTSKILLNICILMLIDRGLLNIDDPITTWWPEFGQGGKDAVTLKHVMTHQSEVPGFKEPVAPEVAADFDRVIRTIEQEPAWGEVGTRYFYHPVTYGYILGELVRRVTGDSFDIFYQKELQQPLALDFHFGLTDESEARAAQVVFKPGEREMPPLMQQAFNSFGQLKFNTQEIKRALIPAANGYGNARSIATAGSLLAMDGVQNGKQLLSSETIDLAVTVHYDGLNLMGETMQVGLGFGLPSSDYNIMGEGTFGWGGMGGSVCFMNREKRFSIAYAMNLCGARWDDEKRFLRLAEAFRQCV